MAKETGRLRGRPSRRAVGRDKQGFGRATPVRLLLSWKAYRMASPGRDRCGVGDRCALGKKRMPAGFYVSCRKSHSNRRHSSGAVGCLLGKSPESEKESYRGKPFGKDTVTCCDRPIVSEEGQEILTEERKELVAEREKTVSEDTLEYMEKAYPDGIDRHIKWVANVGKVKNESSHLLAISLLHPIHPENR